MLSACTPDQQSETWGVTPSWFCCILSFENHECTDYKSSCLLSNPQRNEEPSRKPSSMVVLISSGWVDKPLRKRSREKQEGRSSFLLEMRNREQKCMSQDHCQAPGYKIRGVGPGNLHIFHWETTMWILCYYGAFVCTFATGCWLISVFFLLPPSTFSEPAEDAISSFPLCPSLAAGFPQRLPLFSPFWSAALRCCCFLFYFFGVWG